MLLRENYTKESQWDTKYKSDGLCVYGKIISDSAGVRSLHRLHYIEGAKRS